MNIPLFKALCREIELRYGCGSIAAKAAGVSPGRWSHYCSDEHLDKTIPVGRFLVVASAKERRKFADLLTAGDEASARPCDMLGKSAEAIERTADVFREVRQALDDGELSSLERRRVRERLLTARDSIDELIGATEAETFAGLPRGKRA